MLTSDCKPISGVYYTLKCFYLNRDLPNFPITSIYENKISNFTAVIKC